MPKFEMLPKFEMPKFEMPKFDTPNFEVPAVDAEAITNAAKDVAYISIGVAVLAVQKAQVLGRDVTKTLNEQYSNNKSQIDEYVGTIDSRLVDVEGKWNSRRRGVRQAPSRAGQHVARAGSRRGQVRSQAAPRKVVPAAA